MRRILTSYSLGEISRAFGGEIVGNPDTRVERVGTLEGAADVRSITFLTQDRFLHELRQTRAGAVIVASMHRDATALPRIVCANPYAYFARVSAMLHPVAVETAGVHAQASVDASAELGTGASVGPGAVIAGNARIGTDVIIGAHCYIGSNVSIGAGTRLWPGVAIYHGCRIGERGILHAGAVIGADGFGNAWEGIAGEGRWIKVPQVGRVIIGDDVEIGANTTVDRGAIDDTIIADGVRLDNLIQIAHNVEIGKNTVIAAQTGISGSTKVGDSCMIGGQVGMAGHLVVANNTSVGAKAGISKSVKEEGQKLFGTLAFDIKDYFRSYVVFKKLPDLNQRIKELEKKIFTDSELAEKTFDDQDNGQS